MADLAVQIQNYGKQYANVNRPQTLSDTDLHSAVSLKKTTINQLKRENV